MPNTNGFIRFQNEKNGEIQIIRIDSIERIYIESNGKENSFRIKIDSKSGREYIIDPDINSEFASNFENSIIKILNTSYNLKEYNRKDFKPSYPDDDDESGLCRNNSFEIMGMDFPETHFQK